MRNEKTKRILTLLLDPEYTPASKYEIAKKAGCTSSWVIMFTKKLEKQGLLKKLKVINAKKLFELFYKLRAKKTVSRNYSIYAIGNVDKLIEVFKESGREYAFTTYLAENLLQKHLFANRTDAYIKKEDLEEWHKELSALGVYGGGNVRIIVSRADELFNKKQISGKDGPWIVNRLQLISDLFSEGGPAKEAGEMLLEKLVAKIEARNNVSKKRN